MTRLRWTSALILVAVLAATGCAPRKAEGPVVPPSSAVTPTPAAHRTAGGIDKVLVIAEENRAYGQIIGASEAPYLNQLADTFGTATHMDAGYPAGCPSLAAYILLTSGSTAGICDDKAPKAHPLRGDNIFHQVAATGREWRAYAESAPGSCALDNSADGRYLVRHVPATYFLDDRADCARWAVPLGTPSAGALQHDVAAGRLPAFGFVSPDACHDMHGAGPCPGGLVAAGDHWLQSLLPSILDGPDYRAGRLAVVITWDEGTNSDNHIATLVISPDTEHVVSDRPFTQCSTLRTVEELLRLPLLGCAAHASSMVAAFHL